MAALISLLALTTRSPNRLDLEAIALGLIIASPSTWMLELVDIATRRLPR